jgi:hypothetical protein
MKDQEKRRILLLGLEEGLLWQITRALVPETRQIEYHCAMDFDVARNLCEEMFFHFIVVDGWMHPWKAGYSLGWDELLGMNPWKWIVLVDSLPMGGLLDERFSETAVFLEKPFNPKEFPALLQKLENGAGPCEGQGMEEIDPEDTESREAGSASELPGMSLEPGEYYRTQAERGGDPEDTAGTEDAGDTEPPREPAGTAPPAAEEPGGGDEFHSCLAMGFDCLKREDLEGARSFWERARNLRPDDKRVKVNLRQLERKKKRAL